MPLVKTFDEFCNLPDGILYSYYKPCVASGLFRRGSITFRDGKPIDFFELNMLASPDLGEWSIDAEHPPFDPPGSSWSRWGLYEYDSLFLVYDQDDLQLLKEALDEDLTKMP